MKVKIEDFKTLLSDVLDNEIIDLKHESQPEDIDGWDSLNQVFLIVRLEKEYNIKFNTSSIQNWKCVGDIIEDINNLI